MEKAEKKSCAEHPVVPSARVGEVMLMGRFGGAFCSHYRLISIQGSKGVFERVRARRVVNEDGSFSSVWELEG